MPKNNQNQEQQSEVIFSWSAPDDIKYKKNIWWYIISIIFLGVAVYFLVIFQNPLFAIFLILFYLILLIYEFREVRMVDFYITPDGVKWDSNFHYYKEIDHFYIVYEDQGVKNLYLEFRNPLKGRIIVSIDGQDAVAIREFLLNYLEEDLEREAEPLSERLRRWLKM